MEPPTDTLSLLMLNALMSKRKPAAPQRRDHPRRRRTQGSVRGLAKGAGGHAAAGGGVWLYGTHAVLAALENPRRRCRRLVATATARHSLEARLGAAGASPSETWERAAIDAVLPPGAVHQGIAVHVDPLPDVRLADVCRVVAEAAETRIVVLDQATDPRNVGAVLRAAAAFSATAVIMQDRHAPEATGVLAKAASGALETVPLVRATNLARALATLKEAGFWCVGLDAGAAQTLAEAAPSGKVALVLGAEGAGLRRLTRETCDGLARIPISQAVESLNVATAAAVALYELVRGRS